MRKPNVKTAVRAASGKPAPKATPKPAKLLFSLDITSDAGVLAIYDYPELAPLPRNWRKLPYWWAWPEHTLEGVNLGRALIVSLEARGKYQIDVYNGAPTSAPEVQALLYIDMFIYVGPPEAIFDDVTETAAHSAKLGKIRKFDPGVYRASLSRPAAYVLNVYLERTRERGRRDAQNSFDAVPQLGWQRAWGKPVAPLAPEQALEQRRTAHRAAQAAKAAPRKSTSEQALATWLERHVQRFAAARGNDSEMRAAITQYLKDGNKLQKSPLELRDYFDISTPGILEKAGYAPKQVKLATQLYDEISESLFRS